MSNWAFRRRNNLVVLLVILVVAAAVAGSPFSGILPYTITGHYGGNVPVCHTAWYFIVLRKFRTLFGRKTHAFRIKTLWYTNQTKNKDDKLSFDELVKSYKIRENSVGFDGTFYISNILLNSCANLNSVTARKSHLKVLSNISAAN